MACAIFAVAGALAGALAVWVIQSDSSEAESRPSTRDSRNSVGASRHQPAARSHPDDRARADLATCKRALVHEQAVLRLVREEAAEAAAERLADDGDILPPGTATGAPSTSSGGDPSEPSPERRREREATEKVRQTIVEHLRVSDEEQRILKDLTCSQRDNVRRLVDDFAEGRLDADALFRALRQERSTTSEGLRQSLGGRRYRRLRDVGAIGLLAGKLCKQHSP